MPMLHPISLRALLTSSILALALGGCSFHYSSGSAPPSNHSNHAKHPKKSSSKKVDNSEKPLNRSSGEKPLTKVDNDEKPKPTVDPTPAPKREVDDETAPERTKTAPKRTTGAPKRTPTGDETVEADEDDSPSSAGSLKTKPKPKTPPSSQGSLVAPR